MSKATLMVTMIKYELAKEHFQKCEQLYNKLQKNKKTDDISELYKLFTMVAANLKDEVLAQTYLKKHIETFGLDHPRTKEAVLYLDEKGVIVVI